MMAVRTAFAPLILHASVLKYLRPRAHKSAGGSVLELPFAAALPSRDSVVPPAASHTRHAILLLLNIAAALPVDHGEKVPFG